MGQSDRLGQVFIQPQGACECAGDLGDFQRVSQTCAIMIFFGVNKHLRLVLEPPKSFGMKNSISVTLEFGSDQVFFFRLRPPARCGRLYGIGRKNLRFQSFVMLPELCRREFCWFHAAIIPAPWLLFIDKLTAQMVYYCYHNVPG